MTNFLLVLILTWLVNLVVHLPLRVLLKLCDRFCVENIKYTKIYAQLSLRNGKNITKVIITHETGKELQKSWKNVGFVTYLTKKNRGEDLPSYEQQEKINGEVREHCHISGKNRGASNNHCNLYVKQSYSSFILNVIHSCFFNKNLIE